MNAEHERPRADTGHLLDELGLIVSRGDVTDRIAGRLHVDTLRAEFTRMEDELAHKDAMVEVLVGTVAEAMDDDCGLCTWDALGLKGAYSDYADSGYNRSLATLVRAWADRKARKDA
jgi:hypothetical protein